MQVTEEWFSLSDTGYQALYLPPFLPISFISFSEAILFVNPGLDPSQEYLKMQFHIA